MSNGPLEVRALVESSLTLEARYAGGRCAAGSSDLCTAFFGGPMISFKLHCAFCLLTLCLLGLLLSQSLITYQTSPPARIADLHELAVHLRQKGLDLRGVSSRGDGLWLNTIYLTTTDKNDMEIRGLAVHPS